ncbi:TetR/AcrR family transcriptional regulator [Nocardioides sp. NPDC057767]|uniref:TetR/AcrR family transcriptional regulator n=1 Tax=unclassified Nocardioides TaxID=2615069 RepID=UPI00366BEF2C
MTLDAVDPVDPPIDGDAVPALTRTQRRAAANRRSVVDAAREIVATQGMEALTLEAVAERADVAVQTIYNRVGNRSALLIAVAEQAMEESRGYMDAAYAAEGLPEARLRLVAGAWARFARERPYEFRVLVEPEDEPEAAERLAELYAMQSAKLAATIREGVESGVFRRDLDPDEVAVTLTAAINGILAMAWRPGALCVPEPQIDGMLTTFASLALEGLRRP